MNIRRWLFLAFVFLTTLPLAAVGYFGLSALRGVSGQIAEEGALHMRRLGESAIRQKALDVAEQVRLYLLSRPELLADSQKMAADSTLAKIAVQPVGVTGYTALYDSDGVTRFHSNPKLVGANMRAFAETLPEFWAIFEKSLDGTQVGSYYAWKDPDGTLREKYMECVPVAGTPYRIAATTYIDEFDAPIRETREKAQAVFESMSRQMIWMTALVTCAALLVAFALSAYISGPVAALVEASKRVEAGEFSSVDLRGVEKRKDELGGLARVFSKMLRQVERRERDLKNEVRELQTQVQLLIQIDEERRRAQVQEITGTKYFEELQKKAKAMRQRKKS